MFSGLVKCGSQSLNQHVRKCITIRVVRCVSTRSDMVKVTEEVKRDMLRQNDKKHQCIMSVGKDAKRQNYDTQIARWANRRDALNEVLDIEEQ